MSVSLMLFCVDYMNARAVRREDVMLHNFFSSATISEVMALMSMEEVPAAFAQDDAAEQQLFGASAWQS